MSTWKTIDSAPKDGTFILLCAKSDGSMAMASWRKSKMLPNGAWQEQHNDDWDLVPTHWMPLPEPPKNK